MCCEKSVCCYAALAADSICTLRVSLTCLKPGAAILARRKWRRFCVIAYGVRVCALWHTPVHHKLHERVSDAFVLKTQSVKSAAKAFLCLEGEQ